MERRVVGEAPVVLQPHRAARRHRRRVGTDRRRRRPGASRTAARRERARGSASGRGRRGVGGALLLGRHVSGGGHVGHRVLVLEALLRLLERRGHVEDGRARLDGDDAPGGERAAVADAVDLVDDGLASRRRGAGNRRAASAPARSRRHRLHGGGERLAEDLTAEDGAPAEILALAAEEVLFDLRTRAASRARRALWTWTGGDHSSVRRRRGHGSSPCRRNTTNFRIGDERHEDEERAEEAHDFGERRETR